MQLSIIIPTFNEAENISALLDAMLSNINRFQFEIIVVDGGSTDETIDIVQRYPVKLKTTDVPNRASQMNIGALAAETEVFYFVHADSLPPASFFNSIFKWLKQGFDLGCFRASYDSPKPLMKLNGFFTRFPFSWCRGGDQSLFMRKEVFDRLDGFNEQMVIMEEYEFFKKANAAHFRFKIIPEYILVSDRKYKVNNWWKVNRANFIAYQMFKNGDDSDVIKRWYCNHLGIPSVSYNPKRKEEKEFKLRNVNSKDH